MDTQSQTRPTAPAFYDYLLQTLLDKGPNEAHQCRTVIPDVVKLCPWELESFGYASTGIPQVQSWIMTAWKECRDKGWGTNLKKGWWQITDAGIAKVTGASPVSTPEVQAPVMEAYDFKAPEQAPYHHDPYIVNLAISQTPCFSSYSPRAVACKSCPISSPCQQAFGMLLLTACQALEAAEASPKAPEKASTPKVTKDATIDAMLEDLLQAPAQEPLAKTSQAAINTLTTPTVAVSSSTTARMTYIRLEYNVFCDHPGCAKEMRKGDQAVYDPTAGFFHPQCAPKGS